MRTATYNAQVRTWTVAKQMFGLGDAHRIDIEQELAALAGNGEPDPFTVFRARPKYRTPGALELRRLVAQEMRRRRQAQRNNPRGVTLVMDLG